MEEKWKVISEIPDYEVSSFGKVKSNKTGKILKTWINNNGYECISIHINTKNRFRSTIHRLVAKHFCSGYKEGLVVNHIDANRLNNRANNLEWVTYKENIHDMIKRGTHNVKNAQNVAKKNNRRKIDMYTPDGNTYIKTFSSLKEAGKYAGLESSSKITEVAKGRRFRAGGYHWKYADENKLT